MTTGTIQGHEAVGGATKRGKPDSSVVPPTAVRDAGARADALIQQAKVAREAAPPGSDQPLSQTMQPPTDRATPSNMVMADFDPKNPSPPRDVSGVASITPQAPQRLPWVHGTQAPQPQAPQPQAPQPQSPEEWAHQFKSLQGRFEREAESNRQMARQLTDTQRLLAQLSVPPASTSAGPEGSGVRFGAPPPPPGRFITEKERNEYGDELLSVVARRAQEVTEPLMAQVLNELTTIKRQVGGVQNTVAYDARVKMYQDLAQEVPDWNEINNSAEFLQWLDQPDPISGAMRRGLLNAAHNQNVANRVVAIFKGFQADQASHRPANGGQQPGNGVTLQGNPSPQVDLAQFAAPGRAKPGQTQVTPEKPIFNASDIPLFYRDKVNGKWAGREAEAAALEQALILAGVEGRIRR